MWEQSDTTTEKQVRYSKIRVYHQVQLVYRYLFRPALIISTEVSRLCRCQSPQQSKRKRERGLYLVTRQDKQHSAVESKSGTFKSIPQQNSGFPQQLKYMQKIWKIQVYNMALQTSNIAEEINENWWHAVCFLVRLITSQSNQLISRVHPSPLALFLWTQLYFAILTINHNFVAGMKHSNQSMSWIGVSI